MLFRYFPRKVLSGWGGRKLFSAFIPLEALPSLVMKTLRGLYAKAALLGQSSGVGPLT